MNEKRFLEMMSFLGLVIPRELQKYASILRRPDFDFNKISKDMADIVENELVNFRFTRKNKLRHAIEKFVALTIRTFLFGLNTNPPIAPAPPQNIIINSPGQKMPVAGDMNWTLLSGNN